MTNNRLRGADRAPHTQPVRYALVLAAEYRGGALSQLHLALVMGRRVTHDLLAGADGPRREYRGGALSQLHLALVMDRRVTHDLLAGADGPRREYRGGALSQLHLALVMGRRVTHDPLAHNGPPGIHDLTHGMSPVVYESSPSWYPQPKSIGTKVKKCYRRILLAVLSGASTPKYATFPRYPA